jgi:ATP-binding cassette subfamily B protein
MGMILIILFRSLFELVRQFILAYIARAVDLTLVSNLTRHILHLPMTFFETRQVGEVLSRINDTSKVREAISGTALSLLVDGIMVTTSLSVLWIYDVRLAAVATLFIPLLVAAIVWHHPKAKRLSQQTMEDSARLSAALVEDVSAAETIKALGIEQGRGTAHANS